MLALTESVAASRVGLVEAEQPAGTESLRPHVRPRTGGRTYPGLDAVLDTLLAGSCCARTGWSEAIDLALSRPDLVVVTRDGDRFSSAGWRVRAGGGVVTAAVVDEARARADLGREESARAADERGRARGEVDATREAATESIRADDRNEVAHQAARAGRLRVSADRDLLAGELEELRGTRAELDGRIERDAARVAELVSEMPALERERSVAAERMASATAERERIDERIAEAASRLGEWEVRSAGLAERRRVLAERLREVERRLTGHADERRLAAERRTRLESDATAVGRLLDVVVEAQVELDALLSDLRDRHRRQLEAVRAGGARLEELRRRRSAGEHDLAAVRSRLQQTELDLVEATIRRESVVETLRRDLGCGPEEAIAAPRPELAEGVDPAARVVQLEGELAALGPVNPLALEELSELGERHRFLESQVEDVRAARRELHQVVRTLDGEIMRVFDSAFADVNEHFSTLITSLFPGGTGRLSLTDPGNLLDTGVEVEVRPAGRNVRRLSLLSGGERSLVAMAYLFAVFRSRPSPFYLMDEVEAALDDVNLMRFLALVNEFREEAQLIIVSHQKRTMEAADALYGVTMAPGGSSKVVSQKVPRDRSAPTMSTAPVPSRAATRAGRPAVTDPSMMTAASDVVVGLAVAIPVLVVGGGVAVGLRLRRRGAARPVLPDETPAAAPPAVRATVEAEAPPAATPAAAAVAVTPTPPAEPAPEPATYRGRLGKARELLSGYLGAVRSKGRIDASTWDDLEEALIRADVGVRSTDALIEDLRARVKDGGIDGPDALVDALKADLVAMVSATDFSLALPGTEQPGAASRERGRRGEAGRGLALRRGQRGGQDDDRGEGGPPDGRIGHPGAARRCGHLPRRGRGAARPVGRAGRCRHRARLGGRRPELGGVRRGAACRLEGARRSCSPTQPAASTTRSTSSRSSRRSAGSPTGHRDGSSRSSWSWTPRPARTGWPRPRSSWRRSTSPGWCSPSSTAPPREGSWSPSSASSACR